MPTAQPLRYAHSDGHTDVCFDTSGKHMLTCGTDGDVRIWAGIEDDDAISHRVGDRVYGIVYKSDRFFTSSDTNVVQAHTFPDGAPNGILTRFTAPVNHMVINQSGKTMVACSSDFTIKTVEVDTCSHKTMQGHEAPVLSVALDPKEEFVASSSCDGTVRIWRHSDHSQVTSMNILPKTNDVSLSKTMWRLCWDLKGENLFVPVDKEIQIYERSSWKKTGAFQDDDIAGMLSVMALSPDGKTIAAASSEGNILVMDIKTRKCVDRYRHPKKFSVTSLAWNPKKATELAFCDKEGQLGLLEDIKLSLDSQQSIPVQETRAKETLGIFDDDDDDDMLIQATNDEGKVGMELGADNSDDDDQMPIIKPLGDIDDDTMSKKSDLDDGASVISDVPLELPAPAPVVVEGYKPTPLQNPFQPGSTPVHLSSRFMVWNSIGIIKQYNTEEENSIDIEFHNTSIHHAMHITNTSNYTMADMSSEAVILAAESDDGNPSKLTCMHFGSWDSCKEWTTTMPDGEEILAVTLGEDWIAVATDKRNVRLFSLGGVQREMLSIPGPVVCMAGHTNQLLIVYHRGMGIPGDQCLGVTLMYVEGKQRTVVGGQPLPLSPKTALAWTGFSAEGTPFYMESSGIVRMFNRKFGASWMQVANTKSHAKGKSDHYWIVGVNENPQQLRCIPCKGSRYPAVLPRPAVSILPFQVPLCEMNTEKSQYEETLWKTRLFGQHFDHWMTQGFEFEPSRKVESLKPAQEALMKLFALSARSDREFRALEVCEMMTEQHTLQLAIKYASRIKHMHLAERISELAQQKEEEEAAQEEEEDLPEASYNPVNDWASRNGHMGARPKDRSHVDQVEEVMDEGDEEIDMEEEEEEEEKPSGPLISLKSKSEKPSRPTFISSSRSSNPFKMSQGSQKTTPSGSAKGTQVFDSMNRKKAKAVDPIVIGKPGKILVKPKKSTQGNLFATKTKTDTAKSVTSNETPSPQQSTPSAFDLWLEENRGDLEEEHPDLAETDLVQTAAERFREIPREEKQVWITKAKQLKSENSENVQNAENTNKEVPSENKKRKREESDSKEAKDISNKKKKDNFLDSKKKPLSQNTNSKLAGFAFQKE